MKRAPFGRTPSCLSLLGQSVYSSIPSPRLWLTCIILSDHEALIRESNARQKQTLHNLVLAAFCDSLSAGNKNAVLRCLRDIVVSKPTPCRLLLWPLFLLASRFPLAVPSRRALRFYEMTASRTCLMNKNSAASAIKIHSQLSFCGNYSCSPERVEERKNLFASRRKLGADERTNRATLPESEREPVKIKELRKQL